MHRQPTPRSLAAAEAELGEISQEQPTGSRGPHDKGPVLTASAALEASANCTRLIGLHANMARRSKESPKKQPSQSLEGAVPSAWPSNSARHKPADPAVGSGQHFLSAPRPLAWEAPNNGNMKSAHIFGLAASVRLLVAAALTPTLKS